jgi:hypothetical protein
MNNTTLPLQQISDFFEDYARVLENYDTKAMAHMYNMPCTLLSDEKTTVFNDATRLEGFFNIGTTFYKQFGIVYARPQIWTRREWTDKIMHVKVNWQYFNADKKPVYNCDYHYVLKPAKNNQWKIILSVSVNEKEHSDEWLKLNDQTKVTEHNAHTV